MNKNTSSLQQQYPLSVRKKFWKKILSNIILPYLLFIVIIGIIMVLIVATEPNGSSFEGVLLLLGICVVPGLLIGSIYGWYVSQYIKRYYYSADRDFITIKKGVFAPTEIHVQYQKIQDVYVDQDVLDRFFGLYDVHVASATRASGIEAHIDGVDENSAENIKNLFLESIKNRGAVQYSAGAPALAPAQTENSVKIHLSEIISEKTYPISSLWLYSKILGTIIQTSLASLTIVFMFFALAEQGSLAQIYGWESDFLSKMAAFFGLTIFFSFSHIVYYILWKRNFRFEFTPEHIFTHEEVVSLQDKHVPYGTIQDVVMRQRIIDKLFGLYDVVIQNAAQNNNGASNRNSSSVFGGAVIPGQSLEKATKLAEILKSAALSKGGSGTGL